METKPVSPKSGSVKNRLTVWMVLFICLTMPLMFTCDGGGGSSDSAGDAADSQTEQSVITVDGIELLFIENPYTEDDLWLAVSDRAGEGIGILASRSDYDDKATVKGVMYATSAGEYFTVMLGQQGYPETLTLDDGTTILFTNYTTTTVDLTFFDAEGAPLGQYSTTLNEDFETLKQLVEENGLTFQTNASGSSLYRNNTAHRRAIKLVLRIGGNIISTAACIGSAVGPGTQLLTAVACTSATAGILSTIKYVVHPSGDDPAGNLSTGISAVSCIGLSPPDCWSLLLALFDTHVPDCKVNQRHYEKKCVGNDRVYWFNNCGGLQEVADHCEYACKHGECLPYYPDIDVTVNADTRCVAEGGTIFFYSMVTGGDYNSYIYEWSFAGEGISYLKNDAHTFGTAGEKTITLTVTDDNGNRGYGAVKVTIGECEDYLRAEIQVPETCVEKGNTVSFTPVVTGTNTSLTYAWNFGDGACSTAKNPAHIFNIEKTYPITLTVRDEEGRFAKATRTIQVGDCLAAADPGNDQDNDPGCVDDDDDGYYAQSGCGTGIDCRDNDPAVNPGADEICNDEIDNDCDDATDCDDSDCTGDPACSGCTDADDDGYYAESGCGTAVDCRDNDLTINPGARELCADNVDNDCDGDIDCDDSDCDDAPVCMDCTDDDDDGYYVESGCGNDTDCDDGDPQVHPGAAEICDDDVDNDCDDAIDCDDGDCDGNAACRETWYVWYVDNISLNPVMVGTNTDFEADQLCCYYPGGGNCDPGNPAYMDKIAIAEACDTRQEAVDAACSQFTNIRPVPASSTFVWTDWLADLDGERHDIDELDGCQ